MVFSCHIPSVITFVLSVVVQNGSLLPRCCFRSSLNNTINYYLPLINQELLDYFINKQFNVDVIIGVSVVLKRI